MDDVRDILVRLLVCDDQLAVADGDDESIQVFFCRGPGGGGEYQADGQRQQA